MNRLRDMDTGFGVHVYRKPDLALVLGETGQRLDRTLSSLVAANVLVRAARGVYAFAWSAHLGEATLHTVARRLREIPSVLSSDACLDEMRRVLPARMLVATVESLSWREYASQAVTGLYDPSGPAWASPYGSPGFGRPMPEPDQSSAVPMWRDGGPALS